MAWVLSAQGKVRSHLPILDSLGTRVGVPCQMAARALKLNVSSYTSGTRNARQLCSVTPSRLFGSFRDIKPTVFPFAWDLIEVVTYSSDFRPWTSYCIFVSCLLSFCSLMLPSAPPKAKKFCRLLPFEVVFLPL